MDDVTQAITLIDEINERPSSREFFGIDETLHAKLSTIRATLARHRIDATRDLSARIAELEAVTRELVGIVNDGVSVEITNTELRNAHPEDRRFITRTRKALARANAALDQQP